MGPDRAMSSVCGRPSCSGGGYVLSDGSPGSDSPSHVHHPRAALRTVSRANLGPGRA